MLGRRKDDKNTRPRDERRHRARSQQQKAEPGARKQPHWFILILITAVIGAAATNIVGTWRVSDVWHLIKSPFESAPSFRDRTVNAWATEASTAAFWAQPPTIYKGSVSFIRTHFPAFDPRLDRNMPSNATGMDLGLLDIGAPLFDGRPVVISGRIADERVVSPGNPYGGFHDWQIELEYANRHVPPVAGVAYCRISLPQWDPLPPPRALLAIAGMVIAQGETRLNVPAVYIICSAIEKIVILSPNHKPTIYGTLP